METPDDQPETGTSVPDYSTLPPGVHLDQTIAGVDPDPVPEPDAGRNLDQHRALRDD